ncbi:MAG: M23 family metallopeptidase [Terriglobia bacterium]
MINKSTGAKHRAQDTTANGLAVGSPVYAAEGGTVLVIQSGYSHVNEPVSQCAGQGFHANYIEIKSSDGSLVTRYVHVTPLTKLSVGQTVNTGDQIGTIDISGCTSGPHTHISARLNGSIINFTLPCDNSHFDDPSTWYDDSDGLD